MVRLSYSQMLAKATIRMGRLLLHILLIMMCITFLFPLHWMITASLKAPGDLFSRSIQIIPLRPTLANYRFAFSALPMGRAFFNSMFIGATHTLLSLFLTSLAGFCFAKYDFPGRQGLFLFMLATMMVPGEVGLVPSFIVMSKLRWVNTYYSVIIPGAASAYSIFFMRQYAMSVPDDLLDAGRMDGCTNFGLYHRIVLPVMEPALITFGLITFMGSWNNFMWPLIVLRTKEMYTLVLAINALPAAQFNTPWGAVMAGSTITVIPLIVIFMIFQRRFVSGIMVGAVKG